MKANAVGLTFLALCMLGLSTALPEHSANGPLVLFVYFALAASAFFAWRHPRAPTAPRQWLVYAVLALVTGLIFCTIDYLLFGTSVSSLGQFAKANPGITLEFMAFVLGSCVALAGWARSLVLGSSE